MNHSLISNSIQGVVTYTPRLLFVDLDGTLKHLPQAGELYSDDFFPNQDEIDNQTDDEDDPVLKLVRGNIEWEAEKVEVIKEKKEEKPEYLNDLNAAANSIEKSYNFAETVTSWADFAYSRYHPRTATVLKQFQHSSTENAFDSYAVGTNTWNDDNFADDFSDKIRLYIEECDNCQGFQTLFDCVDGFSGLTMKCLELIEDEYSKSILAIPLIPPRVSNCRNADEAMSDSIRLINIAMTYANLSEFSSLFVPLSTMSRGWRQIGLPRQFPNLNYIADNYYQSSAILATYLDTISLRYRLRHASVYLPGFCNDMTNYGKKMSSAGISLPFQMNNSEDLIDCLDRLDGPFLSQLSPNAEVGTTRVVQNVCVRGIPTKRLKQPLQLAKKQMRMAAYGCSSVSEMFQLYFQCSNHNSMAHVMAVETAMEVKTPYPQEIFSKNVTGNGFLSEFEQTDKPGES